MRPPAFWQTDAPRGSAGLVRALLTPLGALYDFITRQRIRAATPEKAGIPVICVGNLTLGGTGKTPVVRALLSMLEEAGHRPASLSRGWKGRLAGPLRVDPQEHDARDVGDEPLLLARDHAAWISKDRPAGAHAIAEAGHDVTVMDDGHQNPSLHKDLSLVVVDGETGWGAGRVFPAGPLRESVESGLARADAVIVMMQDAETEPDYARLKLEDLQIPVFRAWLEPAGPPPAGPLLAFAGIGRPEKFFDALTAAGGEIAETASFPDHHPFDSRELAQLADLAEAHRATLVTTEKDWVRLPEEWRAKIPAWPVAARFSAPERLSDLLAGTVDGSGEPG